MKKLILTEKPSVARDFAKSLRVPLGRSSEGYFEGQGYIITWALGHLYSPFKPEDYDVTLKRWTVDNLPIIPPVFRYSPISKTKSQLKIILGQLKRKDLEEVIVATDAGREGELIARIILESAKMKTDGLRFSRFWSSQALDYGVIQKGIQDRQNLKEFDRLYQAGRARQEADWLIGMNLSRAATLKWGDLFSIGRVQTSVLWLLVKRDEERKKFKEEKYWKIKGDFCFEGEQFQANWLDPKVKNILKQQHIFKEEKLKTTLNELKTLQQAKEKAEIIFDKEREKREGPPLLFSLTDLQQKANRIYGLTAKKTLSLAQELYEKDKCLSYPRSDSKVLGEKNVDLVRGLLQNFKGSYPLYFLKYDGEKVSVKNKRVFNDDLLTDHHALIPLKPFKGSAQSEKGKIYDLVLRRFIMSFSKDYLYREKKVQVFFGGHYFGIQGKAILEQGWKILDGEEKENIIPNLKKNDLVDCNSLKSLEKKTLPPPDYSEATLLRDMVNPSRLVDEKELKSIFRGQVGLGTQSTRAQMIETLLGRNYVEREGKSLKSLEKGNFLIHCLEKMKVSGVLASPSETARWEVLLEKISKGEENPKKLMELVEKFVKKAVEEFKKSLSQPGQTWKNASELKKEKSLLGKCPLCQGPIMDYPKSFSCGRWNQGCPLVIWKEIAGKKLGVTHVKSLLVKGKTEKIKGFKSKKGRPFEAKLMFSNEGKVRFSFDD
jgi:DNA topoisomerase-3